MRVCTGQNKADSDVNLSLYMNYKTIMKRMSLK